MTLEKYLWYSSWLILVIETILLLNQFFYQHPGSDPAGRGMSRGFAVIYGFAAVLAAVLLLMYWLTSSKVLFYFGVAIAYSPIFFALFVQISQRIDLANYQTTQQAYGHFTSPQLTELAQLIDARSWVSLQDRLKAFKLAPEELNERDRNQQTLLGHAVMRALASPDYRPAVTILIAHQAPLEPDAIKTSLVNPYGHKLPAAVYCSRAEAALAVFEDLLAGGMSVESADCGGVPLLFSGYTDLPRLKILTRYGADLDQVDPRPMRKGYSLLLTAVDVANWPMAMFLLQQGVSLDQQPDDGRHLNWLIQERVQFNKDHQIQDHEFSSFLQALADARSSG